MKAFIIHTLIKIIQSLDPRVSIFYNHKNVPDATTGISIGAFFSPSCLLFKGKAKEGSSYVAVTYGDGGDIRVEKATFRGGRWHVNQGNRILDYDVAEFDFLAVLPRG